MQPRVVLFLELRRTTYGTRPHGQPCAHFALSRRWLVFRIWLMFNPPSRHIVRDVLTLTRRLQFMCGVLFFVYPGVEHAPGVRFRRSKIQTVLKVACCTGHIPSIDARDRRKSTVGWGHRQKGTIANGVTAHISPRPDTALKPPPSHTAG